MPGVLQPASLSRLPAGRLDFLYRAGGKAIGDMNENNMLEIALACAARGWLVHPVKVIQLDNGKSDKKPLTNWGTEATNDDRAIRRLWDDFSWCSRRRSHGKEERSIRRRR